MTMTGAVAQEHPTLQLTVPLLSQPVPQHHLAQMAAPVTQVALKNELSIPCLMHYCSITYHHKLFISLMSVKYSL